MELDEFKENFNGYNLTSELINLKFFQDKYPDYSQGFYLLVDDKIGIKTWSENKEFLKRLMPFAQANGTGSTYGIWNNGTDKPINELPIVVFGDEGGVHIVAENISQLLQMLTFDTEIMVDFDNAYFYKDEEDFEESKDNSAYKNWLKENLNLEPTNEPNEIIRNSQKIFKEPFDIWFGQYYTTE
ncbi:hypothetical protein BH11BAC5_BH11BAC5_17680 [soil metagenome]